MRRITRGEVADIRAKILAAQGFKCAVCGRSLRVGKSRGGAALDHDHDTGVIRGVLCVTCNGGEGKVKRTAIRYGGGALNWNKWLRDLMAYLAFHGSPRTTYIHPTHLTDQEKRLKRNKKARLKRRKDATK